MNNILDIKYQDLLQYILTQGTKKQTRNGEVLSVFGYQIIHHMKNGFPLLTTKKMAWKQIVTELMWFLRGDTNIKYLVDNNCHIWDGDAFKNFTKKFNAPAEAKGHLFNIEKFIELIKANEEFAKKWGDLGPIYGKQWRRWESVDTTEYYQESWSRKDTDQIQNLINKLKTNPDSRRLMVSAWNVGELDEMVLPPCHYGFQIYTRELTPQERLKYYPANNAAPTRAISLMWNQRSVDTFLGLPFNIASYGLLLHILAEVTNMVPGELIGNLGDVHLYSNHIEQAKEQLLRNPYSFSLPNLRINTEFWPTSTDNVEFLIKKMQIDDFQIENYQSYPVIKAPLSN